MISIKNIKKSYDNNLVLNGIDLDINKSEIVAIIGPSGTGKSTFLRCINYLEQPESGSITFDDGKSYDYTNLSKDDVYELRNHSSMVFQNYALFKNMTALENVTLHLKKVKGMNDKESSEIAKYYLNKVKLSDKIDEYPSKLSGGQQQRVGIARAMAIKADIMLLDEPTSSLDPELVNGILELIKELVDARQTMLIVTHEMKFAKQVADKVAFMNSGVIREINTSENIFSNPQSEELVSFLKNIE